MLKAQLGDKSRGTCGQAEVLLDAPGRSPLDLLETVGQRLLMGIPKCGSVLHDGSEVAFVAVGVNISGAASDISVDEKNYLPDLSRCCLDMGSPQCRSSVKTPRYFALLTL